MHVNVNRSKRQRRRKKVKICDIQKKAASSNKNTWQFLLVIQLAKYKMDQPSGNAHSEKKVSSEFVGQNPMKTLFSNAPLFVGFNPKSTESDSVRSPTSPLDLRVFSFLGNPLRSQKRSSHEKVWYRNKVGLSIVDSLDFESEHSGKKVVRASDSAKNILFKPQIRTKPMDSKTNTLGYARTDEVTKSLPKYVANPSKRRVLMSVLKSVIRLTNLCSFSFDSRQSRSRLSRMSESSSLFCPRRSPVSDNSKTHPTSSVPSNIPPSEIELSEDYTCVKIHGPNPKVTHIFCDCILECKSNGLAQRPAASMAYPFCDFLKLCYSCKKNLDGEDIYMYRGEKAFCSSNCRLQVILLDEEMEKSNVNSCDDSSEQKNGSTASLFIST